MAPRSFTAALLGLAVLVACSAMRPPPSIRVSDVARLAGAYTGTIDEPGFTPRPARLVLQRDGTFEITLGEPKSLRANGYLQARPDGSLVYQYIDVQGTGSAYEGGGRRVIVLIQGDGGAKMTLGTKIP